MYYFCILFKCGAQIWTLYKKKKGNISYCLSLEPISLLNHTALQNLQDMNMISLTLILVSFSPLQPFSKSTKINNISSDFIHQGNHHFPNCQSLPGTGACSYHKGFDSQLHNVTHCLYSTSVANLNSLWEGYMEEEIPEELWEDREYTPHHHPVVRYRYKTQHRPQWIEDP